MREIMWKTDIRDGIYDSQRVMELIGANIIQIVRGAKNFVELEGEEWALDYIKR